jgi:hypothetical protein
MVSVVGLIAIVGIIVALGFIITGLMSNGDPAGERPSAFLVARKRGRFRPTR